MGWGLPLGPSVSTRHGTLGYLRIWSFDVEYEQEFLAVTITLMTALPDRALIIDARDKTSPARRCGAMRSPARYAHT